MADEGGKRGTYRRIKAPPGKEVLSSGAQVHLASKVPPVTRIYVYYEGAGEGAAEPRTYENGAVDFVMESGPPLRLALISTWLPPGAWRMKTSKVESDSRLQKEKIVSLPESGWTDADASIIDALKERLAKEDWLTIQFATAEERVKVRAALKAAIGKEILVTVAHHAADGDIKSQRHREPLAGDYRLLSDEALASMFLEFLEHFGNLGVDHSLAKGGLSEEELQRLSAPNPTLVKTIADTFTQGYLEFKAARARAKPAVDLGEFKQMEEVIFYQARARNDLARRNMLRIGIGLVPGKGGRMQEDIGILRRPCGDGTACEGDTRRLLYDRNGTAIPGFGSGYVDVEYRSIDLERLSREAVFPVVLPNVPHVFVLRGMPIVQINVEDEDLGQFLRRLEQDLAYPPREVIALGASLYNNGLFIAQEMYARFGAMVFVGRTVELAVGVFAFFVIHAIAAFFIANPNPAVRTLGYVVMLLAKAAGAILGIDFAIIHMKKLTAAGRHFTQMERLNRKSASAGAQSSGAAAGPAHPIDLPRSEWDELTKLSKSHLDAGCDKLLDAMADYFAMGVVLAGGLAAGRLLASKAVSRLAKAIAENIKPESEARSRLKGQGDVVEEIEPTNGEKTLEKVPVPAAEKDAIGFTKGEETKGGDRGKAEKKPERGAQFYERCEKLKKRIEEIEARLDGAGTTEESAIAAKEALREKAQELLRGLELIKKSTAERALAALREKVRRLEGEVDAIAPRGAGEADNGPTESKGRYVIQEHGELQGEPQKGKVPETVRGEALGPEPKAGEWRKNPGGARRTMAEVRELLARHGVKVDPEVRLEPWPDKRFRRFDPLESLDADSKVEGKSERREDERNAVFAEYGILKTEGRKPTEQIGWDDLLNIDGELVVRFRESLLDKDEAIFSVLCHEMHEINTLRDLFDRSPTGTMSIERYHRLIRGDLGPSDKNLHTEAWDVANALLRRLRLRESEESNERF